MELGGRHLDWQVVSAAQVFCAFRKALSAVEDLTLKYDRYGISPEWNNNADRTHWRELLGSFGNVKTLSLDDGLVEQLSRALQPGEGESPTEPLPELQELAYSAFSGSGDTDDAFTSFIKAHQNAGHPVALTRY